MNGEHERSTATGSPAEARRQGRRRAALLVAGLATVALGLGVRALGDGAWAGPVGDALYAVLIYLVVAFLDPSGPRLRAAAIAAVACLTIELFQLTGVPAGLGQAWPPIRLVLGTTFGAADLGAYAVGVAAAHVLDRALGRGSRRTGVWSM
jgi:hypothetical protein